MQKIGFYLLLSLLGYSCVLFKAPQTTQTTPVEQPAENTTQPKDFVTSSRNMTSSYQVLEDGDSLRIFLEIDIPRLSNTNGIATVLSDFTFNYGLLANYTSKEFLDTRSLKLSEKNIIQANGFYYIQFNIEKRPVISALMLLDIVDTKAGQKILQDIPLNYTVTKVREQFGIFKPDGKAPLFSNHFLVSDTVQFRNVVSENRTLTVRYFNHNFEPASPPMALAAKNTLQNLSIDSVYQIPTNQPIQFLRKGLYMVQTDTTQYYGLSFYVSDKKFPKLSKITDLIDPLIYITTEEEYKQLKESASPKKEMDKLWLKWMSGSVKIAKQTIKEYYQRVKLANKFFTSYKEGWKTDMGMIFIIYGSPNRTIRTNDAEYWFYTQNANFAEMKFTFQKKPNQFSDNVYNLIRFSDYEQIWFPMIELWREGKIQ